MIKPLWSLLHRESNKPQSTPPALEVSWFLVSGSRATRITGGCSRAHDTDEEDGGSIIVRCLICLLYRGGLLSGSPILRYPMAYVATRGGRRGLVNATHVVTSRSPLSQRRGAGPPYDFVERWTPHRERC